MMQRTILFFGITIGMIFFISSFPSVYAHVSFGEFAGNYSVAWVPEPRSPFVGETVEMTFYIRDLQGIIVQEPFIVSAIIQRVTSNDEELNIFATASEIITDGIYRTSYRFTKSGLYRVEFNFGKPDEPNVIRDAVFDIEAREVPDISYGTVIAISLFIAIVMFFCGFIVRDRSCRRTNRMVR